MASDEEIKTLAVKIALDASSFTQQAAAFKRQVTSLDSGFKASVAGIKDWGTQSDHLKDQVTALGRQVDVQKQVVSSYQAQIIKTGAALDAHSKAVVENRDKVNQLKTAYDQSASTLGKNADETKALKDQLTQAEQALSKSESQVRNNQKSIDGYNIQLNNATGKLNEMEAALKNANSALFDHTNWFARAGSAMQSFGGKLTDAGSKISGVGQTLTAGVTAPIVGLGVAAEKTGMDFEAQMSRVQAISGATGDELKELTQSAMDLGAQSSYSDQEVAEGMENMASAGFTVNEIMAAMPGMLNLAASSGEDLASSADIAASTLRGFGLAADQAGHVADVLAKNAANTNAAVADTGLAMKYIAPLAQNAGWSLESVTAAIGEMADAGIKGEQAGTTLRGALTNLIHPSKQQADAMDEIGFKTYDASGHMKSLSQIITDLQKGTEKMTDAQRDEAIATIMGTDALSGMQVLIKDGSGALDGLTSSLEESDGAAQDMADTMLDNTKGSIEQMKGSVENAGIALSKSLSPSVREAADKVTDLANKFAKLPQSTQANIVKFAALAAVVGPVTIGIGKFTEAVGGITTGLGKGLKGVADFTKGVRGITPAAGEAVPALAKLGLAVAANPYLALIGALGAATAAIIGLGIAHLNARKPIDDTIQKIKDENKAWADLKKQQEEKASSDVAEIDRTKTLWDRLQQLVDVNGRVKGSKDEVKYITDLINKTTGQDELKLVGDQIDKYDKAKAKIDEFIKTKRAEIMLEAKETEYKNALQNLNKAQIEQASLSTEISKLSAQIEKDSSDQGLRYNAIKQANLANEKKRLQDMVGTYNETSQRIGSYYATRNQYEDAAAAEQRGDYDKVVSILNDESGMYQATAQKNVEAKRQEMQAAKIILDQMLQDRRNGNKNITDADISAAQDRYNKEAAAYDAEVASAKNAGERKGDALSNGMASKSSVIESSGSLLARSSLTGFLGADFNGTGATAGGRVVSGANSQNGQINQTGRNLGSSLGSGFDSQSGKLYEYGTKVGNSAKSGAQSVNMSVTGRSWGEEIKDSWDTFWRYHSITLPQTARNLWDAITFSHNASGTDYWRGGLTYINERGGELIDLPEGTKIIPHDISVQIAQAVGQAIGGGSRAPTFNIVVNAGGNTSPADARAFASVLSNEFARRINARR